MHKSLIAAFLIILSLAAGCNGGDGNGDGGNGGPAPTEDGGDGTGDDGPAPTEDGPEISGVELDSEVTASERKAVASAVGRLRSLNIDGSRTRWFENVFGGNRSSNVFSYFNRRVNFVLSATTNASTRVRVDGEPVETGPIEPIDPLTVAQNVGAPLWLEGRFSGLDGVEFVINGRSRNVSSTRVGIMQLGPKFDDFGLLDQVDTLVHEARHSDCTGGVSATDVEEFKRTGALPDDFECGHLHVTCPQGHDYANLPACDRQPWGAYSVDVIYSAGITNGCADCSEADLQVARVIFIDSVSRLLFDVDAMVNGELGSPNMSSASRVVRD